MESILGCPYFGKLPFVSETPPAAFFSPLQQPSSGSPLPAVAAVPTPSASCPALSAWDLRVVALKPSAGSGLQLQDCNAPRNKEAAQP